MRSSAIFLSVTPPDLARADAVSAMLFECFWNAAAFLTNTSSLSATSVTGERQVEEPPGITGGWAKPYIIPLQIPSAQPSFLGSEPPVRTPLSRSIPIA